MMTGQCMAHLREGLVRLTVTAQLEMGETVTMTATVEATKAQAVNGLMVRGLAEMGAKAATVTATQMPIAKHLAATETHQTVTEM